MTFVNEGAVDRVLRVLIGLVLGYAAWMTWPGILAAALATIAVIALITGVIGWCPLYAMLGRSTRKPTPA